LMPPAAVGELSRPLKRGFFTAEDTEDTEIYVRLGLLCVLRVLCGDLSGSHVRRRR
jgi:hypothetical protein